MIGHFVNERGNFETCENCKLLGHCNLLDSQKEYWTMYPDAEIFGCTAWKLDKRKEKKLQRIKDKKNYHLQE